MLDSEYAEACAEPARELLLITCASVAKEQLYRDYIKTSCSAAVQMYLDTIHEACDKDPHAAVFLQRTLRMLGQIKALFEVEESIEVFSVFELLAAKAFPRYQDCQFLQPADPSRVTLMVSHRWESKHCPDPTGMQFHRVMRFAIKACMMAMSSSPCVFNSVDFSDTVLSHKLYFKLQEIYQKHVDEWLRGEAETRFAEDIQMQRKLKLLFDYLRETIGESNASLVAPDLVFLCAMMDRIDIWYDYTSLPQNPRSELEEKQFQEELANIDEAFSQNFTIILWSQQDLNRTWCVFEALLSTRKFLHNIFSSDNSILSSTKPAPISQLRYRIEKWELIDSDGKRLPESSELNKINASIQERLGVANTLDESTLAHFGRERESVDMSHDLSAALTQKLLELTQSLRGKDAAYVLDYLRAHNYECTNEFDLDVLAGKLARHMQEHPEQSSEPNG